MSKQYYFAVVVEEDGTAWIDHEMEVNYGAGNVWDTENENWTDSYKEEHYEGFELASANLNQILHKNEKNEKREK
jgi:hypothetical protein